MIHADDLGGKVVVVTGASGGIGHAVAVALASEGAHVVACGRASDRLEAVVNDIRQAGGQVLPIAGDLRDPGEVDRVVAAAVDTFGGIDVLVNNAGGTFNAPAEDITANGWQAVLDTNLTSVFLMCRATFSHLRARQPSSIVNIGSFAGVEPGPGHVHYSSAKAAVTHMTTVLAHEWGRYGIRVNCISPGVIETPRSAFAGKPEMTEQWRRRVPLGWIGRPEDLVGAVLLLASDASAYISGAILRIDGGPRSGTAVE